MHSACLLKSRISHKIAVDNRVRRSEHDVVHKLFNYHIQLLDNNEIIMRFCLQVKSCLQKRLLSCSIGKIIIFRWGTPITNNNIAVSNSRHRLILKKFLAWIVISLQKSHDKRNSTSLLQIPRIRTILFVFESAIFKSLQRSIQQAEIYNYKYRLNS